MRFSLVDFFRSVSFTVRSLNEQDVAVHFGFLLDKNVSKITVVLLTAYENDVMGKTLVDKCFVHFKNGNLSIEDKH